MLCTGLDAVTRNIMTALLFYTADLPIRSEKLAAMTRICALVALIFCLATFMYGDPNDDAKRVERFHQRLEAVGTGSTTSLFVLLCDGETVKGTIEYLNVNEVGIRDPFGHLRPVLLKGVVQFTARNQQTGAKAASTNVWMRTARLLWHRMTGAGFEALTAAQEARRFVIIEWNQQGGAIV